MVDGKITVAGDVTFQNQQAIVKFTLKNKDDDSALSVTQLVVKVGSTSFDKVGSNGYYWSSTANGTDNAYDLYFNSSEVEPAGNSYRYYGRSVRLVQDQ